MLCIIGEIMICKNVTFKMKSMLNLKNVTHYIKNQYTDVINSHNKHMQH